METRMNSLWRHVSLFFQIIKFESSRYKYYPLDFIFAVGNRLVAVFAIGLFWFVASEYSGGALDTKYLVSYFLVLGGLKQIIASTSLVSSLIKKIRMGELNTSLLKPVDTYFFEYSRNMGWMVQLYLASIAMIVVGMQLGGTSINILVVFIAMLNALFINVAVNMLVVSIAFYIVEAGGVKNTILHLLNLAEGFLIPLSLMPVMLQNILFLSPFASALYIPVVALLGQEAEPWKLAVGSFWAVLLMIVARKNWERSLRHYEAIGI